MTNHTFHWQYQKPQPTGPDGGAVERWFLMMDGDEYLLGFMRYNGKGHQEGHIDPGQMRAFAHGAYMESMPWDAIIDATDNGKTLFALSDSGKHSLCFGEICPDVVMPETIEKMPVFLADMFEDDD